MEMVEFLKYLESLDIKRIEGGKVILGDFLHVIINNGAKITLDVKNKNEASQVVILSSSSCESIAINIANGAKLNLVELLFDGAKSAVSIVQEKDSTLMATLLELGGAESDFSINLSGAGAAAKIECLQVVGGLERAKIALKIAHTAPNCISRSLSKCVAGGESTGEFRGGVYVAKDAQQTEAHQNSRNIALNDNAKIIAEPQLEIYADDVKCSHGATVGQMNKEAIFYMQQRGLSENQARKVQLEGFVSDVTSQCSIESLIEPLSTIAKERLERC